MNSAPVHILQLTDCHFPRRPGETMMDVDTIAAFDRVATAIVASGRVYDRLLLTGDLVHEPSTSAYGRLRSHLQAFWPDTVCHCLPGNHDDRRMMQDCLSWGNVRTDAHIELDHWRIVLLDSSIDGEDGGFLQESQFQRLHEAIALPPQKHLLVAVHHHPTPVGSRWMDTMVMTNGSRLLELLAATPQRARAIVFGHVHQLFDRTIEAVRVLGTPSTCVQFKPQSESFALDDLPPGYRWIALYPDGSIDSQVVYLTGPR